LTIEFTPDGLTVLAANSNRSVIVDITTTVNAVGEIKNLATVFPDKSGDVWLAGYETDEVETRWGTVDVLKEGKDGPTLGAVFRVWAEVANPEGEPATIKKPVSVGDESTWTTDEDGKLTIEGLRYSRFADDVALFKDGEPFEDGYVKYWLEEIKAPKGHELLAEMIPFEVDDADKRIDVTVTNVPSNAGFVLPPVGGIGSPAWYRTGLLLVCGALVLALQVRRRRMA
jgi:hypothetical protein